MIATLVHVYRVTNSLIREHIVKPSKRSDKWPAVRRAAIKLNPTCAVCGGTDKLQVHHMKPFADDPELELNPTNLIVLCMGKLECHLKIGHSGESGGFRYYNPNVVENSARILNDPTKFNEVLKEIAISKIRI